MRHDKNRLCPGYKIWSCDSCARWIERADDVALEKGAKEPEFKPRIVGGKCYDWTPSTEDPS